MNHLPGKIICPSRYLISMLKEFLLLTRKLSLIGSIWEQRNNIYLLQIEPALVLRVDYTTMWIAISRDRQMEISAQLFEFCVE